MNRRTMTAPERSDERQKPDLTSEDPRARTDRITEARA